MKSSTKLIILGTVIFSMILGCKRDELDFDKFSKYVKVERDIAMPLTYGEMYLKDLIGDNTDSVLTIESDSIFFDTLNISFGDLKNLEIDFCDLHYVSKNYLPVGFNLSIVTYDSVTKSTLDTIKFSTSGMFLEPAPLDSKGNVIESQVVSKEDVISLDKTIANNLLHRATHIIINAELLSDTTRIIPVNKKNYVWLDLGIAASGAYTTTLK